MKQSENCYNKVDVNSTISMIIYNVNGRNMPIKHRAWQKWTKK